MTRASSRHDPAPRRLPWHLAAAVLALVLGVWRAHHLDGYAGAYTGCSGCFLAPVLAQDAWMLAVVCALLAVAAWTPWAVVRGVFGLGAVALLAGMTLDVVLLKLLVQRFYLADLLRFGADAGHDLGVARAQLLSADGWPYAVLVLATLAVCSGLLLRGRRSPRSAAVLGVAAACALAAAAVGARLAPLRYVHAVYAENLIVANLPQGRERPFTPAYAAHQHELAAAWPRSCTQSATSGTSVVLVLTESLSAYQSALLGGPRDWLPQLDALAQANHYFTHFYANGFGTDGGEIAALTGRAPLVPPGAPWYALPAFGAADDTLVGAAHRAGYGAHYFTTADLSFLDSGPWLRQLGFDSVEGNEAPFYRSLPRGPFGAPDDAALFARFLDWLDTRSDPRPFVAVLLTVESHPPFLDPRSGRSDEQAAFRRVDADLAGFAQKLQARGWLAHGVLAITGDHRSMTPLSAEEFARFGARAFSRVPLIVAGAVDLPQRIDAAFQQSDLPGSVAALIGAPHCASAFAGTLLTAPLQAPQYVLHARGDDRNRVDVYFNDKVAGYALDGDASRWLDEPPPDPTKVAAWIDTQRLRNAPAEAK